MDFKDYLDEIQKCIDNKLYIASLTMSLTLPDACGLYAYGPKCENSSRYKKWFSENIGKYNKDLQENDDGLDKTPWLSADLIYSLRNYVLHEATPNLKKSDIKQEENKIDKFNLDFSDSYIMSTSNIDNNFNGTKIISYRISAKYVSIILLNCAKRYYKENKEKIDSNYKTIKDGFGDAFLWTK